MTSIATRTITCAKCKRPDEFRFYDSINVTLTPALREQVLRQTLFDFCCRGCGLEQIIAYPFLYHDMKHHLMCWMAWSRSGAPVRVEPGMNHDTERLERDGYRLRVVGSLEALTETVLIAEASLDDLTVQVLKASIRTSLGANAPPRGIYFSHLEDGSLFFALVGLERPALMRAPAQSYEQVRAHLVSINAAQRLGNGYKIIDAELGAGMLAG